MKKDSELKWSVAYEPGVLSAIGYKDGRQVSATKVETTGSAADVALTPDRASINADGEDVSVVTVSVTDAAGRIVPVADNRITFALDGPGRIIGVGNGDPSCHEPDVYVPTLAMHTVAVGGWRWHKVDDVYAKNLPEVAVGYDDSAWTPLDVTGESGPLGVNDGGVFRTTLEITTGQLGSRAVELWFGQMVGDGAVYVNGERIARTAGTPGASIYDMKARLHPGANIVAVALKNWGATGGLSKGVMLRIQDEPAPVTWQRSVFNGLAQVIVQSRRQPGTLHLTASAPGLRPVTVAITSRALPLAPAVP